MAETGYKVKSLKRCNGQSSGDQPQQARKFQTFEDLEAYQVAREFRKAHVINGYGRFLRQKRAGKASALHEGEAAAALDENDDPFADVPL